eukprot:5582052-Amphidinium_carterae.1
MQIHTCKSDGIQLRPPQHQTQKSVSFNSTTSEALLEDYLHMYSPNQTYNGTINLEFLGQKQGLAKA